MRDVVPVRLGNAEREQIAQAAEHRKLALSSFIREAALQASADVQGKASVKAPAVPERAPARVTMVEPEPPKRRMVEGEWVDW